MHTSECSCLVLTFIKAWAPKAGELKGQLNWQFLELGLNCVHYECNCLVPTFIKAWESRVGGPKKQLSSSKPLYLHSSIFIFFFAFHAL
jgi:hypothetical protein